MRLRGPTCKGREGRERKGKRYRGREGRDKGGRGGEGRGGEGRGGEEIDAWGGCIHLFGGIIGPKLANDPPNVCEHTT